MTPLRTWCSAEKTPGARDVLTLRAHSACSRAQRAGLRARRRDGAEIAAEMLRAEIALVELAIQSVRIYPSPRPEPSRPPLQAQIALKVLTRLEQRAVGGRLASGIGRFQEGARRGEGGGEGARGAREGAEARAAREPRGRALQLGKARGRRDEGADARGRGAVVGVPRPARQRARHRRAQAERPAGQRRRVARALIV